MKTHAVYRIYYGDSLVYVGRTNQPLQARIRGHLFAKPMHRILDIKQIGRIEYHEFEREADMNLYEIYFILTLKPPLNVDDKTRDYPTVTLPDVAWETFSTPLWDKWKKELLEAEESGKAARRRLHEIPQEVHVIRSQYRMGQITEDEKDDAIERLCAEEKSLRKKLGW